MWNEVSDWIDRKGQIANSDLCQIAQVDTLEASRMLKTWVEQGVLVALADRSKRNMAYTKTAQAAQSDVQGDLLSRPLDNNEHD